MTDEPFRIPLDLDSPAARAAVEAAFALVAALRGAAFTGDAEAWTAYESEIARVGAEALGDSLRLAWLLHGLATVGGTALHAAAEASGMDALDVEVLIQRTIETLGEAGHDPHDA